MCVPLGSMAADDEEIKVSIAPYRGGRDAAISYTFGMAVDFSPWGGPVEISYASSITKIR